MQEKEIFVRSRITHKDPGLTKGKKYKFIRWGYWQFQSYFVIVNDRNETVSIMDPNKYLYTEDIKKSGKKSRAKSR